MRKVEWHDATRDDLLRIAANQRARINALVEVYLSQVPPYGANKLLDLGDPWGVVNQLSIDDYRILYDVFEEDHVAGVLLVFEKPPHGDTKTALKNWLGTAGTTRRRSR